MTSVPADRLHQPRRWLVLAVFAVVAGVTQMLWLNFAPLLSLVEKRYGVSELLASCLVLVFPLVYVFLSLPAGALMDSRGYRYTVGLGAILTAAFAALRIWDTSFWVLLIAQLGIAVAQPFVMNGISKLVADWFDEGQGATANGIGTMGMFLGMAIGMAATPSLEEAIGLRWTMVVFFAIAAIAAAAFVAVVRENGASPGEPEPVRFGLLVRQRELLLCFGIGLVGLGAFNGLTTWLEEILAPRGINATTAGLVGGVLILGGIVGAVVIPLLADRSGKRRPYLLVCTVVAAACTWLLCRSSSEPALLALGATLGFFFLPGLALLLDLIAQLAGARHAGAATSVFMLAGNAGAVVVIVLVPILKDASGTYSLPVTMMSALLLVGTVLVVMIREPARGSATAPPAAAGPPDRTG